MAKQADYFDILQFMIKNTDKPLNDDLQSKTILLTFKEKKQIGRCYWNIKGVVYADKFYSQSGAFNFIDATPAVTIDKEREDFGDLTFRMALKADLDSVIFDDYCYDLNKRRIIVVPDRPGYSDLKFKNNKAIARLKVNLYRFPINRRVVLGPYIHSIDQKQGPNIGAAYQKLKKVYYEQLVDAGDKMIGDARLDDND